MNKVISDDHSSLTISILVYLLDGGHFLSTLSLIL
jgi:hypothetical protein